VCTGFLDGGRMWNDSAIEALRLAPDEFINLGSAGLGTFDLTTTVSRRAAIDQVLRSVKHLPPEERAERVAAIVDTVRLPLRTDLMMTSAQVRALSSSGMTLGAHSVTHPILSRIEPSWAQREIGDSRDHLQQLLAEPVRLFAYPNGFPGIDYGNEHVEMVRDLGFAAACSTAWGAATAESDPLQLPRFTPWDRTATKFGLRMLGNMRRTGGTATA
jgi:hypothetical protein